MLNRRLVITVTAVGFLTETDYQTTTGYWSNLSRTVTTTFPFHIVGRIADRDDYRIYIRAR